MSLSVCYKMFAYCRPMSLFPLKLANCSRLQGLRNLSTSNTNMGTSSFVAIAYNSSSRSGTKIPITTVQKGSMYTEDFRLYYRNENGPISPYHDIPLHSFSSNVVNMISEIPRWSNAKMEMATKEPLNPILQDIRDGRLRFVANCFPFHGYIWNYGALPQTWENPKVYYRTIEAKGDNDPLDICELGTKIHPRGAVIQVKILGCLALVDEGEADWKLLAIDVTDPQADKLNDINDIEKLMPGYLKATMEWFRSYKVPDGKHPNHFAFDEEAKDAAFAMRVLEKNHKYWVELSQKEIDNDGGLALERTTDPNSPFALNITDAEEIINGKPQAGSPASIDLTVDKWSYIPDNLK